MEGCHIQGKRPWITSIPVFPLTLFLLCFYCFVLLYVSWLWIGTKSCCPSSASVMSKAWLWRARALGRPLAARNPQPPPPAVPAQLCLTPLTHWSRYQLRQDFTIWSICRFLVNCHRDTRAPLSSDAVFFCLQEKSLPGVVMALVCNVFEMLYQLANLDESRLVHPVDGRI